MAPPREREDQHQIFFESGSAKADVRVQMSNQLQERGLDSAPDQGNGACCGGEEQKRRGEYSDREVITCVARFLIKVAVKLYRAASGAMYSKIHVIE